MEIGTGDESETLIISDVASTDTTYYDTAVTAQGAFTPAAYGTDNFVANTLPSIDTTKFNGGSKAADTWNAGALPQMAEHTITVGSASFTGNTADDLKVNGVTYKKQTVYDSTFTPVAATLGFSGTTSRNVLVTGVNYDKATANGAIFTGTEGTAAIGKISIPSHTMDVEKKSA